MARDALAQLLNAELSKGLERAEVVEETIDLRTLDGPENKLERTALAELLAGTDEKKSKAYKAQRRNVERWAKGRAPKMVSIRRIVNARRQQSARLRAYRERGGEMRVKVMWYAERRAEWLPPRRWIHQPREVMRSVIRKWARDEHEAAANELWREFLERYEVPNVKDWLRDVIVVDLMLEPA
jgi:hypothetical protein